MTASNNIRGVLAGAVTLGLVAGGAVAANAVTPEPTAAPAIYIWNGDGDDSATTLLQESAGKLFGKGDQLVVSASKTDVNAEIQPADYVPAGQTATKVFRFVAPAGKTAKADWTAWDLSDAAGPTGGVLNDDFTLEDHAQGNLAAALTAGGDYWVGLAFTDGSGNVLGTAHRTIHLQAGTGKFTVEGADEVQIDPVTGSTPTVSAKSYAVGQTLTAKAGTWGPAGVALGYQWLRDGKTISGATKSSYKLVSSDAGRKLSVRVTGTTEGTDPVSKTSKSTVTIAKGTLTARTPAISGTAKVGATVKVKTTAWAPSGVKLSYQWLRNGKAISKATKSSYKLSKSDKGKKVSVKVTGKLSGYNTASKTSASKTVK